MFKPRPPGTTLARPATAKTITRRAAEHAIHDPHEASERIDPEFMLTLRCRTCGRIGQAQRKYVRAAINEHVERFHSADDPGVHVEILYPKQ